MSRHRPLAPVACLECRSDHGPDFDITMAFQPIVERHTGQIFAHEALVRAPDGTGAASVFERITAAQSACFDQACRTRAILLGAELGIEQFLAINFAPGAVTDPERSLRSTLCATERSGFPNERIIFEIVKSEEVADSDHLGRVVDHYREHGFRTALDDVGAGHGGLNLMVDLRTDFLKVDRHLIRDIADDPRRQGAVAGLLKIADSLGTRLIAEGVETSDEMACLISLGVELMQGFFIARPEFEGLATVNPHALKILRTASPVQG